MTTAPAATSAQRPTVTGATQTARAPIEAPSRSVTPTAVQSVEFLISSEGVTALGKWSLVTSVNGDLWIEKQETLFNPLDPHWTHVELVEAENFLQYIAVANTEYSCNALKELIRSMSDEIDDLIDQRHRLDMIDADEI